MTDVSVENHGSLMLFRPNTDEAARWFRDTAPEDAQFWGSALVVEPRYADGVVEALLGEGFTVE